MDYKGLMGVPITFIDKYNPEQFEILGLSQKVGYGLKSHTFYDDFKPQSALISILNPILKILKPKSIMRIKANLFPNLGTHIKNEWHIDRPYDHKGALFYINTNNGFTELEDGSKIESIENRLLLFDSSKKHRSTHCTDKKSRVNINFNYF